jgi:hypothetical protein
MEHTPEQRAIIQRIGEVNRRIDEAVAEQQAARAAETRGHTDTAQGLIEAARGLAAAIEEGGEIQRRSAEIHQLCRQHGDLFREFLDTL